MDAVKAGEAAPAHALFVKRASLALLLVADAGVYSVAYTGHGVLKGLVFAHVPSQAESTAFTAVNFIIVNDVAASLSRFLSAPVARYLVHVGGRDLYATVQLAIATASLSSALLVLPRIRLLERLGRRSH